jgi:exodeoxyribonuclease III
MKKIISYNVNGLRAALKKDLIGWLKTSNPDIFCMQEIKAESHQVEQHLFEAEGYHCYWHSAQKKGYSGVALLSKQKPDHVEVGCGIEKYDNEGRFIRADFGDVSILNVYIPSGSSGEERQAFKMVFLKDFQEYINQLKKQKQKLIIVGDYNICHQSIDIHNPVSNKNSSGFLPEERAWIDGFIKSGFIDSFRHVNKQPHQYTWWTYRFGAREKNLGWRIDYQMATENLGQRIKNATILSSINHSDHCPILLELNEV